MEDLSDTRTYRNGKLIKAGTKLIVGTVTSTARGSQLAGTVVAGIMLGGAGKDNKGDDDNKNSINGRSIATDNKVAKMLFIIGVFIILGGILSGLILSGDQDSHGDFSWTIFLITTISSGISGMLFIGLGEIIKLLDKINSKIIDADLSNEIGDTGCNKLLLVSQQTT